LRPTRSVFNDEKKLSIAALSQTQGMLMTFLWITGHSRFPSTQSTFANHRRGVAR